jgi:hypothetical protein
MKCVKPYQYPPVSLLQQYPACGPLLLDVRRPTPNDCIFITSYEIIFDNLFCCHFDILVIISLDTHYTIFMLSKSVGVRLNDEDPDQFSCE